MSKKKEKSIVPVQEVDKEKEVSETFEGALKRSISVLPNLATISERLDKAMKLVEKVETRVGQEVDVTEDKVFLVAAHVSAVKSSAILMDSARKYLDSLAKMWGLGLAPVDKEEHGLFDPDALLGDETEEEIEMSMNNSMFGKKGGK